MTISRTILVAGAALVLAAPAATSAQADVVRKTVTMHEGAFGQGCRTVRTVHRGPAGKRVDIRRVCR